MMLQICALAATSTPCRLIDNKNAGLARDQPGKHDLLLVSAAHSARLQMGIGRRISV